MIRKLILCFLVLLSYSILGEISPLNWGKEQGSLNWKDAHEKCKLSGMRLPTKKELLSLYNTKDIKKMLNNWYWTSDELDTERAWIVVLNVGDTVHIPKQYHNSVRCVN